MTVLNIGSDVGSYVKYEAYDGWPSSSSIVQLSSKDGRQALKYLVTSKASLTYPLCRIEPIETKSLTKIINHVHILQHSQPRVVFWEGYALIPTGWLARTKD